MAPSLAGPRPCAIAVLVASGGRIAHPAAWAPFVVVGEGRGRAMIELPSPEVDAFELGTRKPAKGLGPAERGGTGLDGESAAIYSGIGRPSIAPERLLRGSLLQIIFSVRPDRQLMEQMDYNLMFRWFVGLGIDDPVWDHSVYSKNRTPELGEEAQDTWRSLSAS